MEKKITAQKITPNLWFDREAEEAVKLYTSIFKNSSTGRTARYGKEGFEIHNMPEGTVLTIEFYIEGQQFLALNGGPQFKFNESISFIVNCGDQGEINYYWDKLKEGGDENAQVCGWLKDKFGVSWQIVPVILTDMLHDKDQRKVNNMMAALFQMKKLEINKLKEAFEK